MPKRKKKIGNVNVSHPEVTFTKFSWLPFRRDSAHREKIQDSAGWLFRGTRALGTGLSAGETAHLLSRWGPILFGSSQAGSAPE